MKVLHTTGNRALDEEINRILERLDKAEGKTSLLQNTGAVVIQGAAVARGSGAMSSVPNLGVTSLAYLTGDITLSGSSGVTITQLGQNIDFSAATALNNTWTPILFAQPSGANIPANAMLIMNPATD